MKKPGDRIAYRLPTSFDHLVKHSDKAAVEGAGSWIRVFDEQNSRWIPVLLDGAAEIDLWREAWLKELPEATVIELVSLPGHHVLSDGTLGRLVPKEGLEALLTEGEPEPSGLGTGPPAVKVGINGDTYVIISWGADVATINIVREQLVGELEYVLPEPNGIYKILAGAGIAFERWFTPVGDWDSSGGGPILEDDFIFSDNSVLIRRIWTGSRWIAVDFGDVELFEEITLEVKRLIYGVYVIFNEADSGKADGYCVPEQQQQRQEGADWVLLGEDDGVVGYAQSDLSASADGYWRHSLEQARVFELFPDSGIYWIGDSLFRLVGDYAEPVWPDCLRGLRSRPPWRRSSAPLTNARGTSRAGNSAPT